MNSIHRVTSIVLLCSLGVVMNCTEVPANTSLSRIRELVDQGHFQQARQAINTSLERVQDPVVREALNFEVERMSRIDLDFRATQAEVLEFIRPHKPDVRIADLARWEKSRALESMVIDGEHRYFNRAARNLFRIDTEMRQVWTKHHPGSKDKAGSGMVSNLDRHNLAVIAAAHATEGPVLPLRFEITQSIEVPAGTVPAGETVRAWIPFPREIPGRQADIELIDSSPSLREVAPADAMQRTVYFEAPARAEGPLVFSVTYRYSSHGIHQHIEADKVRPTPSTPALAQYLAERPPHIVFSDELVALSKSIVGDESNPYRIARKLFAWTDANLPWASAREYSSLSCIPEYARLNRHGDCGIQTLFFITLCRLNGIPARWQSGWEFQPPEDSMHDWGMIYFEPYGWVPMDVTYGLRKSADEDLKWFYLSGMDAYRLIFNDDYSQPFFPAKEHVRSETVDSQRGEVEWRGGNLYFNQWKWDFQWKILESS